jgi:quaternary ammonium compound-resistance protein SugE
MAWMYVFLAGLCEIGWAVGLKYTEGFTKVTPSVATIATMALSMWLLSRALQELPIGTAYAIWTGIGAVGTAIIGMAFMGEPRQALRILCIGLIVAGMLGLKLTAPAS